VTRPLIKAGGRRARLPLRATGWKLKNGLPAMVIERQRSPSVAVELAPSSTSLMNPAGMPGVAAARK